MSSGTGIELKAILDSRIKELESVKKSQEISTTRLKLGKETESSGVNSGVNSGLKGLNSGVLQRAAKDLLEKPSDLEASWVSLSRKSILYTQMSQDANYDDNNDILVDFTKKDIKDLSLEKSTELYDTLDPWVETIDEYGRNRLVRSSTISSTQESNLVEIQSSSHYDSTREIRNLGTSYYKLSQDEISRAQELKELKERRQDTVAGIESTKNMQLQRTRGLEERKRRISEAAKVKRNKK